MKSFIFLLLFIPFSIFAHHEMDTPSNNGEKEGVEFFKGTFISAKQKAEKEGKLIFLDFTASWCTPCQWMEQTTFTNPTLAAYVKENYIAVKVDIDDFDGFALKQKYKVRVLPSMIVFNSKGEILGRYEESFAPTKMLSILKQYEHAKNSVAFQPSGQTTYHHSPPTKDISLPSTFMVSAQTNNMEVTPGSIVRKPLMPKKRKKKHLVSMHHTPETEQPILHNMPATFIENDNHKVDYKPVAAAETIEKPTTRLTNLDPTDTGEGLYRFEVRRQPSKGFSVQVGAYQEYGNVLRHSALLERQFEQPIIVHISKSRNLPLYKLMVGEFSTRNEAMHFLRVVQAKGIEAILKDLSYH